MSLIKELRKYCKEYEMEYSEDTGSPFTIYPKNKKILKDVIEILKKYKIYKIWWQYIYFKGCVIRISTYQLSIPERNYLKDFLDKQTKRCYNKSNK